MKILRTALYIAALCSALMQRNAQLQVPPQYMQDAQKVIAKWAFSKEPKKAAPEQLISNECLYINAQIQLDKYVTQLDELQKFISNAAFEKAWKLHRKLSTTLNKTQQAIKALPENFDREKRELLDASFQSAKELCNKLGIELSTKSETTPKIKLITEKIDDQDISTLDWIALGEFIDKTFQDIIALENDFALNILLPHLAQKCSMSLDVLEIICINSYEQKAKKEGGAAPEIPPLPGEESGIPTPPPPMDMETSGAGQEGPPPPPPMVDLTEKTATGEGQPLSILEQLKGTRALRHVEQGGKTKGQPGREDLLKSIQQAVGKPRVVGKRPIISLDAQVQDLTKKIERTRQEIQQMKDDPTIQTIQKKVDELRGKINSLETEKAGYEAEKVRNNAEISQSSTYVTRKQELQAKNGELNKKINAIYPQLQNARTTLAGIERTKPYSSIAAKDKSLLLLEQTLKDKQPQTDAPTQQLQKRRGAVKGEEEGAPDVAPKGLAAAVTRAQGNPAFQARQTGEKPKESEEAKEEKQETWPTD